LSFKYTAGLALVPLAIAALARLAVDRLQAILFAAAGALAAAIVFTLLDPYLFSSFSAFWRDLHSQADVAANQRKAGQEHGGLRYYLDSLGWGLGWAGLVAAVVGGRYFGVAPDGRDPPWLHRCARQPGWSDAGWSYPGPGGRRICGRFKPGQFSRPDGGVRASAYHQVLSPSTIEDLRFYGYCT